ncbi:MAG: sugar phosphate nucleotidyltransferase [Bacteroidia bacterium]
MKAVIPVAGVGTKLRPHTHTQPKPLIPVAGKPILGHIIENLLDAGIRKQVFIVGYLREKIQEYVETRYAGQIEMEFVVQEPRLGLAHAIWTAREVIRDCKEILVLLGDTIFGDDTRHIIEAEGGMLAVHQVDDPREFGIAMLDEAQYVKKLSEKPDIPTSNLALVGMYKITHIPVLLEVLEEMIHPSVNAEYSLTDALMQMIVRGVKFRTYRVDNWFDCGRKQSLLLTNRILLERLHDFPTGNPYNSVIIPPVYIAEGCEIRNSIIGPYTAIAENARIENSIVRNSILGAYSRLESIILNHSVIGNDTTLKGKANSINIGDNTEIDFDE